MTRVACGCLPGENAITETTEYTGRRCSDRHDGVPWWLLAAYVIHRALVRSCIFTCSVTSCVPHRPLSTAAAPSVRHVCHQQ